MKHHNGFSLSATHGLLQQRFSDLLERHVQRLTVHGHKASGLCPFHKDRRPSFSADLEKGVWYCFPCGRGGGIKDFALAVGEQWITKTADNTRTSRRERAHFAVQIRRRQAEEQARTILKRRKDQDDKALCQQNHGAIRAANEAAELLSLFHRHPDLAEEFPELVARTEREYSEALFKQAVFESRLGESWR
ncbi:MAG: CHC2 zinc finger domain-containing protein [Candidatus Binatia bacterium]